MDENPWEVENIQEFSFLCCPECAFKSKEESMFQEHALNTHPRSSVLFNDEHIVIKQDPDEFFLSIEDGDDTFDTQDDDFDMKEEEEEDEPLATKRTRTKRVKREKKEDKKYTCSLCEMEFDKRCEMRLHKRTVHTDVQCEECGKTFDNPVTLRKHMYNHSKIKCEECGKMFARAIFGRHMSSVHVDKSKQTFQCDACPFTTFAQRYLNEHMIKFHDPSKSERVWKPRQKGSERVKTGESKPKAARKPTDFNKTENRRYECKQCNKTFCNYSGFKQHWQVIHLKSAPYKCKECPREFGVENKLKSHITNVHTRVTCDICGQEICNIFVMQKHKAEKHGIYPEGVNLCDYCPEFFKYEKSLLYHVEKKHKSC